jgi:hypothetical protein
MDRAAVEAYLNAEYPELIVEANLTGELDVILDSVDAALTARPDVSVLWANALADYFLLKRVRAVFAVNFDVRDEDGGYSLNQQYKNVEAMLAKAEARVLWIVDPVIVDPDSESIGKVVTVSMPYLNTSYRYGGNEW